MQTAEILKDLMIKKYDLKMGLQSSCLLRKDAQLSVLMCRGHYLICFNVDIDECTEGSHNCAISTASCTNTPGAFTSLLEKLLDLKITGRLTKSSLSYICLLHPYLRHRRVHHIRCFTPAQLRCERCMC